MSHTTTCEDVPFTSEAVLRQAVDSLKKQGVECELEENAVPRMYYPDQFMDKYGTPADLVLKLKDCPYDIGFIKKDGKFIPVFDDFCGYVSSVLGNKLYDGFDSKVKSDHFRALTVEYNYALQMKVIKDRGYTLEGAPVRKSNGEIKILCHAPKR